MVANECQNARSSATLSFEIALDERPYLVGVEAQDDRILSGCDRHRARLRIQVRLVAEHLSDPEPDYELSAHRRDPPSFHGAADDDEEILAPIALGEQRLALGTASSWAIAANRRSKVSEKCWKMRNIRRSA